MNTAALKSDLAFLDGLSIILDALEKFLVTMLLWVFLAFYACDFFWNKAITPTF